MMGEAGRRLADIEASKGAAGDISACKCWQADISVKQAADRVESAETAVACEYLDLAVRAVGEALIVDEIQSICKTFDGKQKLL